MVDGKICSSLTETKSAATCYICKAKPKEMYDLEAVRTLRVNIKNYDFGLSTLHA